MGTTDVRVDVKLNKYVWSRGIRSVPRRVRVRIARKRNDDEDAKEELYSLVTVAEIPAEGLKGLGTKIIDDEEWFIKNPTFLKYPAEFSFFILGIFIRILVFTFSF